METIHKKNGKLHIYVRQDKYKGELKSRNWVGRTYINGKQKAAHVNALIVPGSQQVAKQIQEEGLTTIFEKAGFEIRQPGCSACLAMNDDKIPAGEYCVSTSNRNFEGRQGQGARTLLSSPLVAAAIAVEGKIIDITKHLN